MGAMHAARRNAKDSAGQSADTPLCGIRAAYGMARPGPERWREPPPTCRGRTPCTPLSRSLYTYLYSGVSGRAISGVGPIRAFASSVVLFGPGLDVFGRVRTGPGVKRKAVNVVNVPKRAAAAKAKTSPSSNNYRIQYTVTRLTFEHKPRVSRVPQRNSSFSGGQGALAARSLASARRLELTPQPSPLDLPLSTFFVNFERSINASSYKIRIANARSAFLYACALGLTVGAPAVCRVGCHASS